MFLDGVGRVSRLKARQRDHRAENSGKSQLLELVRIMCNGIDRMQVDSRLHLRGTLDAQALKPYFHSTYGGPALQGHPWQDHGVHLVGVPFEWEVHHGTLSNITFGDGEKRPIPEHYLDRITGALSMLRPDVHEKSFRHLLADRDIQPEPENDTIGIAPNGSGATNVIRKYINSKNLRRELVQSELRRALNDIFGSDGQFDEIVIRQHDENTKHWEVFLGEEGKGLVGLSDSGSGLKTILLVLLNILVVPKIENRDPSAFVFAFEELENNLHPALLRRLLRYIEAFALRARATIFLTTHSSVALDLFGISEAAQIVHVANDGVASHVTTVTADLGRHSVLDALGARPSDLLQANGVIWVEGPSDVVYITNWIELFTEGKLRQGRDYICAFYGGSLLAQTQLRRSEDEDERLVNLLRINRNAVIVCDGDRK